METKNLINITLDFFNSERQVFVTIIVIGILSFLIGIGFNLFSLNYKVFAKTLLVLGILEVSIFALNYVSQSKKIQVKINVIELDKEKFLSTETMKQSNACKSFIWVKLTYALLIVAFVITTSISKNSGLNQVLTALIIHLAFAITVDIFAENYTKVYFNKLMQF
jgi:hypothetical protein